MVDVHPELPSLIESRVRAARQEVVDTFGLLLVEVAARLLAQQVVHKLHAEFRSR
ncbi:MAG TPA: hypothetical protein VFZ72_01095 [Jiangellaceae bacterium]